MLDPRSASHRLLRIALLTFLTAAAAALGCKQQADNSGTAAGGGADAGAPIKIGVYGPFTGGSSPMGLSMRDGVRLAADEINGRGGVLGKQIELVGRDDQAQNG